MTDVDDFGVRPEETEGGSNSWGVEYHLLRRGTVRARAKAGAAGNELILASDRNSGLWIFRYTGGK